MKFTPRGGRVWLSALGVSDAVELRVADTGPSISCAQLEAIFEPVVQVHPTDEMNRRGAGLGLAIARDLTRLMGGELFVRSAVGVSSLFAARFPAAARTTFGEVRDPPAWGRRPKPGRADSHAKEAP